MDDVNRKRPDEGEGERSAKRRKLMATISEFLDIEATGSESEGEEIEDGLESREGFIDYDLHLRDARSEAWECGSSDDDTDIEDDPSNDFENGVDPPTAQEASAGQIAASSCNDNVRWDDRMSAVINRYESTSSGSGSQVPNIVENEEITALAERLMRMPTSEDPGLWRVRVWEGAEEESFFLLHERLKVRSQWAVSVFLPPCARGWICVESTSWANVEDLCLNLSTIPHPVEILFVPAEERVEWIDWHYTASPVKSPSWVRLKRTSELKDLLDKDREFDKRLIRYANDLAYVQGRLENGLLLICLVPRLLPPIESDVSVDGKEGGEKKKRRRKRVARLLHPKALAGPKEAMNIADIAHPLDPKVWWAPKRTYELERIAPGVYELAKPKSKRTLRGGDLYMPPFAYYTMPVAGVHTAGVVPRLAELRLFAEGMAIGTKELKFRAPDAEFIRWTYENHVAAPVEIGQKVEASLKTGMIRGFVEDIRFEQVVVHMELTEEEVEVEVRRVRRIYDVGDRVKVVNGLNIDREGWVVNTIDDHIDVLDHRKNEQFDVKCWQVVPHESFKWQICRKIQAGDMVQVINPLSAEYHKTGTVCNVTAAYVEVTDATNTKFTVPPWFLEVDEASRLPTQGGLNRDQRLGDQRLDDRYKELINTWVVVSGNHPEKGLYGRIRNHQGKHIMSVEASSGSKVVDIHVDFLLTSGDGGRDLRDYHVGRYPMPTRLGYAVPSFIRRTERAKTPMPDEPVMEDNAAAVPTTTPELGTVDNQEEMSSPRLQLVVPMISYENQVLRADWMMRDELVTKRIYAYVRNSEPDAFNKGGFANGVYEGDRVLVLAGERVDAIEVHARKRTVTIPGWFLFPQMPTAKGQDVVVISGDKVGEVFLTRKPKEDGSFPLGRRGFSGLPLCTLEPSKLTRCDPK